MDSAEAVAELTGFKEGRFEFTDSTLYFGSFDDVNAESATALLRAVIQAAAGEIGDSAEAYERVGTAIQTALAAIQPEAEAVGGSFPIIEGFRPSSFISFPV